MSRAPQRILVTGGSGFLGRACVEHLVGRGDDVYLLSRSEPQRAGTTWMRCDLADAEQVKTVMHEVRPSRLLHLAWHARASSGSSEGYQSDPVHDDWVGISRRLFETFAEVAPNGHIVGAGSAAEYGAPAQAVSEDEAPVEPLTRYAVGKRRTHAALSELGATTGIQWSWPRVFQGYGTGESRDRIFPRVTRALLAGAHVRCNHSEYVRDLVLDEDVAIAIARLLDSPVNDVVNVGTGVGTRLRDVLTLLATLIGTPELLSFDARQEGVLEAEPAMLVANVERQRRMIGFVPSTPLAQGLERTIAYWRDRPRDG